MEQVSAAVAIVSRHEQIRPMVAAFSTVLASVTSTLVNLPIVYQATRDRILVRNLFFISLLITIPGLISLGVLDALRLEAN